RRSHSARAERKVPGRQVESGNDSRLIHPRCTADMCGIAGFQGAFDARLLDRMSLAMAHRGPDDQGSWFDVERRVGMAHRRLSIIDLSRRGHQPMWDVTHTAAIVYNGEIYNYQELRKELVADGFSFDSECDTEVLLNLYLRDGEKLLERLNGIFAFALWDTRR